MTVIGSFGNAEDATMIVVMRVIILIIFVMILIRHRFHHRHCDCDCRHHLFLLYISHVALGTIGHAEDAVMRLIVTVVILIIDIRMISMTSASAALVMQRMLR